MVLLTQMFLDVKLVTGLTDPNVLKEHTAFKMLQNSNPATQFIPQENCNPQVHSAYKSHILILHLVIMVNKLFRFKHCWPVKRLTPIGETSDCASQIVCHMNNNALQTTEHGISEYAGADPRFSGQKVNFSQLL